MPNGNNAVKLLFYRLIGDPMPFNTREKTRLKIEVKALTRYFQDKNEKIYELSYLFQNMEKMTQPKTALITGVTGQDGAILAQILLDKNYDVHGMRPYSAVPDTARIAHLEGLHLHYGDLTDGGSLLRLIDKIKPDEIYNMAGLSHVHASFDLPEITADINALGVLRLLEVLRVLDANRDIKFYQASSSEMFGRAPAPQNEDTPFSPCSPYGNAKLYAY